MSLHLAEGVEVVPGYVLVKKLGRGGFGEVWEAGAPGGFRVALKFIRLETDAAGPELRALEVIRHIRHPHLLDVQFTTRVDDDLVIAMPLCESSLLDRLRACPDGLPRDELLGYMDDLARAIDYLNEPRHPSADGGLVGVQHRDIKPHNIFLVGDSVRLADFGLAKALEGSRASHTGSMSPQYVAPEVIQGHVSSRSDQYSLGITYAQLRTGMLPIAGDNVMQLLYKHLYEPPELSGLPDNERAVVDRALAKIPEKRWPTCRAFACALEAAARADGRLASSSVTKIEPELPFARRVGPTPASETKLSGTQGLFPVSSTREPRGFESRDRAAPPVPPSEPPKEITNAIGMKLVLIPAGEFAMGSPDSEKDDYDREKPQHRVRISRPFYLAAHEVTQGQYQRVMGATPSFFKGPETLPVEQVSWVDAVQFCNELSKKEDLAPYYEVYGETVGIPDRGGPGYRLPTEAEWEYACRAGRDTKYCFGDDSAKLDQFAWYDGNSKVNGEWTTHPVGQKEANAWGLHDMHGNVWEWCWDWYNNGYYKIQANLDQTGSETGDARVLRGGSYVSDPVVLRSSYRFRYTPSDRNGYIGFRPARAYR